MNLLPLSRPSLVGAFLALVSLTTSCGGDKRSPRTIVRTIDLHDLRELALEAESAQDLQRSLNRAGSINRIDFNGDGVVDRLRVQESWTDAFTKRTSIYANQNEIAVIDLAYLSPHNIGIYIYGNEQFYDHDEFVYEEIDFDDLEFRSSPRFKKYRHYRSYSPKGGYTSYSSYKPYKSKSYISYHKPKSTTVQSKSYSTQKPTSTVSTKPLTTSKSSSTTSTKPYSSKTSSSTSSSSLSTSKPSSSSSSSTYKSGSSYSGSSSSSTSSYKSSSSSSTTSSSSSRSTYRRK